MRRSAVHDVLRAGGRPLDDATRTDMEDRFGADFSDIRIHTDASARKSAAEIGARAYTSGNHIVIGDGGSDRHTLAHELTHVIQQRQGPVAGTDVGTGLKVSDPCDRFERAAEANAIRVMSLGPGPAGSVQRAGVRSAPQSASKAGPPAVQRAGQITALKASGQACAFGQGEVERGGMGTVALVPAVLSDNLDLFAIADKYRTGFTGGTAPVDRFALVIGVNCWLQRQQSAAAEETLLRNKINDFTRRWDNNRFRVEVVGFTWADHRVSSTADIDQATIPYGEIRDHILRHRVVRELVQGLTDRGRDHVYLHTGDSDTRSFGTKAGPLFSAAAKVLDSGEKDLFSGGYTASEGTKDTDEGILIWHANQVDLAVRDAMAEVNPRSVYYPEPNTFVKVKTDWDLDQLEDGISFGTGRLEGEHLVNSLRAKRDNVTEGFDSRYAISTDMDRVGMNVGGHRKGQAVTEDTLKKLFELTQSHARKQEWQDRVAAVYRLDNDVKLALAELVYAKVTDLSVLRSLAAKELTSDSPIDTKGLKTRIRENRTLANLDDQVVEMAVRSRNRLLYAVTRAYKELSGR
ncbi:eCIS core domain-containing protein [Streptomyces sp. S186]|uniref:eCIS core domain-containing protein n=1 Tax=Streptomyces sp. S186 TaxID=3434395 RepID=UPI003F681259